MSATIFAKKAQLIFLLPNLVKKGMLRKMKRSTCEGKAYGNQKSEHIGALKSLIILSLLLLYLVRRKADVLLLVLLLFFVFYTARVFLDQCCFDIIPDACDVFLFESFSSLLCMCGFFTQQ